MAVDKKEKEEEKVGTSKEEQKVQKDGATKDAKKKKEEKKQDELSEEDLALKQALDLMVERLSDSEAGVQKLALESMRKEIRTATSSMTSVPKPLKFLRQHYALLKSSYNTVHPDNQSLIADVISVLAMTMSEDGARESLKYRLLGSTEDLGSWGHEYVRNLAGEIGVEYQLRQADDKPVDDLMGLVQQIVPFHVEHNAEPEAVDLLMEVEHLDMLVDHIGPQNYSRTCLYLTACASYVPEPEDMVVLEVAYRIYRKVNKYLDALRVALRMNRPQFVRETFTAAEGLEKKQLAYLLSRQGFVLNLEEEPELASDEEREALQEIMCNTRLCEGYLTLARDLDVMEPKLPEDIYKAHLIDGRASQASTLDSARQNLAATFVNAFVNAGFGQDKLLTAAGGEGSSAAAGSWLFKNKEHGKVSATASLGMIVQWDVDGGLPQIDKYLYTNDNNIIAGALLAVGIVNCGVRNECDPAYALLCDSVEKDDPTIRIGAIMGLGLAYAGTCKEEVLALLAPVVTDTKTPIDVAGNAALALGLVFVSSCNEDAAQAIILALMERDTELSEPLARYLCLGLGLLFLGQQEAVDATVEVAKTLNEAVSGYCQVTLDACAYAGTGNVLKVQQMLALCSASTETPAAGTGTAAAGAAAPAGAAAAGTTAGAGSAAAAAGSSAAAGAAAGSNAGAAAGKAGFGQGAAVLGIAMVAIAEELGSDMAIRSLEHLLQYGDASVRRAVPLALGLLSISNPRMGVMDTLGRLTHDSDAEVAMGATLSLGLIGAGTNNARIAGMLRNLSSYYYKDPTVLFCVRIAQGLVHLGKGLLTLNPYHSDRFLCSNVALAGLAALLHSCLDIKGIILHRYHYALYYIVPAMQPRMLLTVDEDLKPLSVPVRVGQAVDVVGQAGRPKTITGFQTHTTPVLLATGDRAELATDKYIPLSSHFVRQVAGLKLKEVPNFVKSVATYDNVMNESTRFLKEYHRKYIVTSSPTPLFQVMSGVFVLSYAVGWPAEIRHMKHAEAAKEGGGHH
ncbi:unnamed protein product [Closterium sp. NIES-64]|nr:unnamed protein product [Closterium sp. NIES-64]